MSQVSGNGDYKGFRLMKMEARDCDPATKIHGVTLKYAQRNNVTLSPPFCLLILGTARQEKPACIGHKIGVFIFLYNPVTHTHTLQFDRYLARKARTSSRKVSVTSVRL